MPFNFDYNVYEDTYLDFFDVYAETCTFERQEDHHRRRLQQDVSAIYEYLQVTPISSSPVQKVETLKKKKSGFARFISKIENT